MADVKIVLNSQGVRELLRSEEIKAFCEERASKALSELGDGHELKTVMWPDRVTTTIHAVSYKAKKNNLKNNTILKALRGGA